MSSYESDDFQMLQRWLTRDLKYNGEVVNVGEWQSIKDPTAPQSTTIELCDVHLTLPIPRDVGDLQDLVKPTLPWAEDHFLERVSGKPLNPPPSASYWNKNKTAVDVHRTVSEGGVMRYSHTYPERFWPKNAGPWADDAEYPLSGIRFNYGDLADVVALLARSPLTRQAYLPVWFPEDTGTVHGERVPCTLGYHFLLRNGRLNVYYFIRSCDFFRHFANDVYLAARLCQWVWDKLTDEVIEVGSPLHGIVPGNLIMQISSLHIFEAERKSLDRYTS